MSSGFVYFIAAACGSPIKIGWSVNPERRLRTISAGAWSKTVLVTKAPGTKKVEAALHRAFRVARISGEWFEKTDALTDLIMTVMRFGVIPAEYCEPVAPEAVASMSQAEKIIGRFGGTRATANALGLPPSTVQSWKDTGFVPAKHHQHILERARELGKRLEPKDFFELDTPKTTDESESANSVTLR